MVLNHHDDSQFGIIGESFADKQGEVQRKPSSVSWIGIRQFGVQRLENAPLRRRQQNAKELFILGAFARHVVEAKPMLDRHIHFGELICSQ